MYVGHVGLALAIRARRDAPSLWLLVLAAQGPDWVEALWGAVGYRWMNPAWGPHGFVWLALGTGLAAVAAIAIAPPGTRGGRAAALTATAYLSHWIADYFTGLKPTWPGGPLVGLGWYGWPLRDLVLEASVIAIGWWLWRRALPEPRRAAPVAWALLGALLALQLGADLVMAGGVRIF